MLWLERSGLANEHLVRQDEGVVFGRSVRRINKQRWSGQHLRSAVETPQKPKSATLYVPTAVDLSAVLVASPEEHEDKEDDEDHEMQAEPTGTTGMAGPWSSSQGEKRTEAQDAGLVER